jgi:hypothetical protein
MLVFFAGKSVHGVHHTCPPKATQRKYSRCNFFGLGFSEIRFRLQSWEIIVGLQNSEIGRETIQANFIIRQNFSFLTQTCPPRFQRRLFLCARVWVHRDFLTRIIFRRSKFLGPGDQPWWCLAVDFESELLEKRVYQGKFPGNKSVENNWHALASAGVQWAFGKAEGRA